MAGTPEEKTLSVREVSFYLQQAAKLCANCATGATRCHAALAAVLQPLLLGIREIAGKSPVCRVDEQIQILSDFGQIDETPRVAGAVSLTWAGVLRVTAGLHRGELDLVMAGKRWREIGSAGMALWCLFCVLSYSRGKWEKLRREVLAEIQGILLQRQPIDWAFLREVQKQAYFEASNHHVFSREDMWKVSEILPLIPAGEVSLEGTSIPYIRGDSLCVRVQENRGERVMEEWVDIRGEEWREMVEGVGGNVGVGQGVCVEWEMQNPLDVEIRCRGVEVGWREERCGLAGKVVVAMKGREGDAVSEVVSESVNGLVSGSVGQSMGQSMGQSINESMGQSMSQSMNKSMGQSMNEAMSQSMGQSINESIGHSIGQSINPSINPSINNPINNPINHSIINPINNKPHNEPHNESLHQPHNPFTNQIPPFTAISSPIHLAPLQSKRIRILVTPTRTGSFTLHTLHFSLQLQSSPTIFTSSHPMKLPGRRLNSTLEQRLKPTYSRDSPISLLVSQNPVQLAVHLDGIQSLQYSAELLALSLQVENRGNRPITQLQLFTDTNRWYFGRDHPIDETPGLHSDSAVGVSLLSQSLQPGVSLTVSSYLHLPEVDSSPAGIDFPLRFVLVAHDDAGTAGVVRIRRNLFVKPLLRCSGEFVECGNRSYFRSVVENVEEEQEVEELVVGENRAFFRSCFLLARFATWDLSSRQN